MKQPIGHFQNRILILKQLHKYVFDESGKKDKLIYNECKNEGVPIVMVDAINHALQ